VGSLFKALMKNDKLDFNVIKLFDINTRNGKFFCHFLVRWEFPSPGWVKINIDGVVRGILVLLLVNVFSVEVWGSLLVFSFSVFLEVQTTMVVEFYGVIHAIEEAQKMGGLLMSNSNVILTCFVLHLLLKLMFRGCFVIDEYLS